MNCQKPLKIDAVLWGNDSTGLMLASNLDAHAPRLELYTWDSTENGGIHVRTPQSGGAIASRVMIPGKSDFIDIKIIDSNIIPYEDNYQDLGSSSNRWKNIYAVSGNFSGVIVPESINTLEEKIESIGSYTVIVYKNGSGIYAKDASGNIIAQGNADTDDRDVIQAAIDALPSVGGRVVLAEGIYYITAGINLRSSMSFTGQGASTVLFIPDQTNPAYLPVIVMYYCVNTLVSDIKIDGNRDNQASGREGGFHIKGGSHCKIINTWICNIYGTEGNGIYVDEKPSDFLIQGNTIENVQDDGMDINGMVKSQIIGNNIRDCGDNGIDTEGAEYVTFSGNVIHDCGGSGLELEQEETTPPLTRYCAVTGNTIFNCEANGIHIRSGGYNTISGNTIKNCSGYGIFLGKAGSYGAQATHNIVVGNLILETGNGIHEDSGNADYNFFSANYIKDTVGYGEYITGLHSQSIDDFWSNDYHYPLIERKIRLYKNYQAYDIPAYSIVIKEKNTHRPYAVDTTTTKGDDLVLGVAIEDIKSLDTGFVLTEGRTKVRVNGSNNIYRGDFIGTYTERGIACKAESGDMGIAIALENYTEDNSSGLINVLVCTPRKIGSENVSCNCSALEYSIQNLSENKLSRDGSQSMTGLLRCDAGLETDSFSSFSGDTIECTDNLKVTGDVIGDSADGLNLKAENGSNVAMIELSPGSDGKILMSTPTSQGVVLPRIEIPDGIGNVDVTFSNANIIPSIDNWQNLGSLNRRWKNIYAVSGNFSGTIIPDAILENSSKISNLEARVEYLEEFLNEMKYVEGGYTVIVYKDNDTIYAKEADGDIIMQQGAGIDDRAVIQSAINALPTEGGRVILGEGTFILNSPVSIQRDYVILEGQGWMTILKVADYREESDYGAIKVIGEESAHIKNIILRNFQVDGNRDNQDETSYSYTPHVVGAVYTDFLLCDHLYVHHSMGDGIETGGNYHWFINNHVSNCREHEIHLNGIDYAWVMGNYLHDDDAAVLNLAHGGASHAIIKGNIIENAGSGWGLIILAHDSNRKTDILIEGNILKNAKSYAIDVGTDYSQLRIINNYFYSGTNYAIHIPSGSDGTIIHGNHIKTISRGISVGAERCIVSNNLLEDVKGYPFVLSGSRNLAVGNILENCGGYNGNEPVRIGGSYNIFEHNLIGPLHEGSTDTIYVSGDYSIIRFNDLRNADRKTIVVSGTDVTVKDNKGYTTENWGTATILSGYSSVTVDHGLVAAPSNIRLTGTHSEVANCWVEDITDSQFTIHTSNTVTANRDVYWIAETY